MNTLESRIAAHLGLPGIEYVPEDYFEYVEPADRKRAKRKLAEIALSATRAGEISGTLGLEYIQSGMFFDMLPQLGARHSLGVAYHGSPHELTSIKPRQATWSPRTSTRYRFADGEPAICASPTPAFPTIRSLLHEDHPEIAAQTLELRKSTDISGRTSWVTSEEALEALQEADTIGHVYAVILNDARDDKPAFYDQERAEYRIYEERSCLAHVPVTAEDLPRNLCVISAKDQDKLKYAHLYENILRWGEGEQIPVRPLGGLWPKEYFS